MTVFHTPRSYNEGLLVTEVMLDYEVRDQVTSFIGGGLVPDGMVMPWGDSIDSIPDNFKFADGSSGTVNTVDRFIVSAGHLYTVGQTGGASSVTIDPHDTHVITQPGHVAHLVVAPVHSNGNNTFTHIMAPTVFIPTGPLGPIDNFARAAPHVDQALTAHEANHTGAALANDVHAHGAISLIPVFQARPYMEKIDVGLSFTTPRDWTSGEVPTAADFNTEFRDNPNYLWSRVLRRKAILAWTGSVEMIPPGWHLCDGTAGTPNLVDRFVPGAGGAWLAGQTGGVVTQSLGQHGTHDPTQPDPHADHIATQAAAHDFAASDNSMTAPFQAHSWTHSGFGVDAHEAHANFHANSHDHHADVNILPPYLVLGFIMLTTAETFPTPKTWTNAEIVQSTEFDTYVRDMLNAIQNMLFPIGGHCWWAHSVASCPAGYGVGAADIFVLGGTNQASHNIISTSGGSASFTPATHATHLLTQPSNHASHVVTQPDAHTGTGFTYGGISDHAITTLTHTWTVDAHDHHSFTIDDHSVHDTITTLPPFLSLPIVGRIF